MKTLNSNIVSEQGRLDGPPEGERAGEEEDADTLHEGAQGRGAAAAARRQGEPRGHRLQPQHL